MTTSQRNLNVNKQPSALKELVNKHLEAEELLREGGGAAGKERQKRLGRLFVRERISLLIDSDSTFFEMGLWAGYKMYEQYGALPAAGVVAGIGKVHGRDCLIIGNDATVKAGSCFPQTVKKMLRAQRIAYECRLPTIYLVDSSGVFLPLQDEIFPDEDDFGRIFRNNAVMSAAGIPQYAAIMGNCIAGGAYLPLLCDTLLMTEGSGLYLAGPTLVKEAIGQEVETEELGGASMHSEISGTVDFHEANDPACLERLRSLIDLLPPQAATTSTTNAEWPIEKVYDIVGSDNKKTYDIRDLLCCIIDQGSMLEFKSQYGKTLVTTYAKIDGHPVGIIANQRLHCQTKNGGIQIGSVIYNDSADKAARFVMDCNQSKIPLLFLQDVVGFMVGRDSEQSGIIRSGAKLVNVISNSIVPKITIVIGNSYGAGNYALCGKAYDPNFILAWPNAKYAVMGADQSSGTLFTIQKRAAERKGKTLDEDKLNAMREEIRERYHEQAEIRYAAARGWVDGIIEPHRTREVLSKLLPLVKRMKPPSDRFHSGVLQV